MLPIGSLVSRTVYTIAKNSLLSIPKGIIVEQGISETIHEYRLLNSIQTISRTCIETAWDEIISVPVQEAITEITGWDVNKMSLLYIFIWNTIF